MILHGYWRSGASYRVRIALALKGIGYDLAAAHAPCPDLDWSALALEAPAAFTDARLRISSAA